MFRNTNDSTVSEKIYCSIDLELSGFDPSKSEILEVGLVFFKLNGKKFEIVEEWSSVFRPKEQVKPNILGLTGLTQEELDKAPKFSEFREFLSKKLRSAVLVGHNVALDIKFLEAFGVKTSGVSIDSLDLAQIFLPTHHSYNLENLMHFFKLNHANAHRALADARAVVFLLEKFAGLHSALKPNLRKDFDLLLQSTDFTWKELISTPVRATKVPKSNLPIKNRLFAKVPRRKQTYSANVIYSFSFDDDLLKYALKEAKQAKKSFVITVPDKRKVLELMKNSSLTGLFLPQDTFSETAYKKFFYKPEKTQEEIKFLLKVLIWKGTNWQTQTIRDINVNFSGGQFLQEIIANKVPVPDAKALVCDHETFLDIGLKKSVDVDELIILDISAYEDALMRTVGHKISWNGLIYLLKAIYNPETNFGNKKYEKEVVSAMAAVDLFFGLVLMKLKPKNKSFEAVSLRDLDPYKYAEIQRASVNLVSKLRKASSLSGSAELQRKILELENFFGEEKEVKWVEYNHLSCIFQYRPIDILSKTTILQKKYSKITVLDRALSPNIVEYYVKRLGLKDFSYIPKTELSKYTTLIQHVQALGVENVLGAKLPVSVLFSTQGQVKRFYESNYKELKQLGSVLAQNVTGGSTKLIRNFSINPKSIMLASTDFIFRNPWAHIHVESLFISKSGLKIPDYPYTKALSRYLLDKGIDYEQVYRDDAFRKILRSYYNPKLRNIQFFP